jgi:hypothetical protein
MRFMLRLRFHSFLLWRKRDDLSEMQEVWRNWKGAERGSVMTAFEVPRERLLANFKPDKKSKQTPVARRREKAAPGHRKLIIQLPCCICGKPGPSDPHHLMHKRGSMTKAPDSWLVPLCLGPYGHHTGPDGVQFSGTQNENAWFQARGIENPAMLASELFAATGDIRAMQKVLFRHMNGGF